MYQASVIIPVYNEACELEKVLRALENQSIPRHKFEILVVDNGSDDHTQALVREFSHVVYLLEDDFLNSPYSCRNRGIENSTGSVIVLLDGTCIPEPDWLENGLNFLTSRDADIVSSNVLFDFRGKVTAGKLYDSNNLKIERSIERRGAVMTASLFVRREVFDKIGLFPEGVRSGADLRWTSRATRNGFTLEFCRNSIAKKRARTFLESVHKQWRVGKAQPAIWKEQGIEKSSLKKFLKSLIPFHPGKVNSLAEGKGENVRFHHKFKLYFVAYFIWIVMSIANMYGSYQLKSDKIIKKLKLSTYEL